MVSQSFDEKFVTNKNQGTSKDVPFLYWYIYQTTTIQQSMKVKDILQESMLIVGCVVGVSFVTGKEAQAFVGNAKNILLFAVIFGVGVLVLRSFCNRFCLQNTLEFAQFTFKKRGHVVYFLLLGCYFVCLVTTLATVQNCFDELLCKTPFSLWSLAVVLVAIPMVKLGAKSFKTLSILAFVGAFATFLFVTFKHVPPNETTINPLSTTAYSLFSLTMVLPVCCTSKRSSKRENILCVLVATATIALLLWWVERVADFTMQLPIGGNLVGVGKVCLCVTISLCGLSGAVGNALPICQGLADVIPDKTLLSFVVLGVAWAISCLGLEVFLKYGYVFVAVVGLVIVARCLCIKNYQTPSPSC